MQVITDFRAPDNIRFGFAPIYTSFSEIARAVARLQHVMQAQLYEKYPAQPPLIT
jgi:kynureninase